MSPERPVLLYDGECRFCRFLARCVVRLDRRSKLAILPLTDAAAASLLEALPADERLTSWRFVRRDGSLVGYGGVRGRLPDALYAIVARHRGRLGRLVPDGPAPRRYP
ncbi:MAG TPA: DCC1-like thiol-disulfide oxidoreductase family protein [Gaiellaceae bacterium]|nr:DCC1-like thiol-disulfide oxidoreductase family protein [Gaiellaceae bacterium]